MKIIIKFCVLPILCILCFFSFVLAKERSIVGKWKTIDDKTNEPKSIVEIYEQDKKFFGQIKELFRKPGEDPDPICDKCPEGDSRKDQPTKGMIIIKDLVRKGNTYKGGTILDPKEGKIYDCKLWIKDGKLMVRGYIAFFFRTQTWEKVE